MQVKTEQWIALGIILAVTGVPALINAAREFIGIAQ